MRSWTKLFETGIYILIALPVAYAFGYLLLKGLDREAYRQQVVCENHVKHGYQVGPCLYWKGERP